MHKKNLSVFITFLLTFCLASSPLMAAESSEKPASSLEATTSEAATSETATSVTTISETSTADPYEHFNRSMFNFNEKIDKYIMKPVAQFYNLIMPRPLNEGVHNVFMNINTIPTIVNDLLQANFFQATNDLWRLGVNTTIGVGGLFDMATRMKLHAYTNDFGLTLARWGFTNSNYLVLPFWGPRTVRDTLGMPVDYFLFSVYPYIQPQRTRYIMYGLAVVDTRAQLLKHEDVMEAVAVDRYAFLRNAYMQYRDNQIEQNNHRTYADLKDMDKPVSIVDAKNIPLPTEQIDMDTAE